MFPNVFLLCRFLRNKLIPVMVFRPVLHFTCSHFSSPTVTHSHTFTEREDKRSEEEKVSHLKQKIRRKKRHLFLTRLVDVDLSVGKTDGRRCSVAVNDANRNLGRKSSL